MDVLTWKAVIFLSNVANTASGWWGWKQGAINLVLPFPSEQPDPFLFCAYTRGPSLWRLSVKTSPFLSYMESLLWMPPSRQDVCCVQGAESLM